MPDTSDDDQLNEQLDRLLGAVFKRLLPAPRVTMATADTRADSAQMVDALAIKLAALLEHKLRPPAIPFEVRLWSTKEIGEYLQRPVQVVRDRVVCVPDFPEAIRLPNVDGGRAYPRWKAIEVVKWVESHQNGRRGGRPRKTV